MTFDEILSQVQDLLQREKRVSYRGLKRRFALDDEYLEDLKEELIGAKRLAVDEDGRFLVWMETSPVSSSEFKVPSLSQPPAPNTQHLEAERRQLTVMFCDLVDSTALSAQLDPEELREVIRAYQETCTEVIRRYDGHVAQHLGDGLLVYFGYPLAHEDDARRAVRTGLEIITALHQPDVGARRRRAPTDSTMTPPLRVRIGIHTGLVVIGEIGSSEKREMLALGETPNIAARVQGTANPDEVMISATTYRLVEDLFTCEDCGHPELKGVATPLTLYRVTKESEAHSRFEVVVRKGLTPLVGREHEFGLLRERWERVKDGAGQVVLLSGEPGIGKSRLVEALKETVEHEGARCLELHCSSYAQNSGLQPVIEHLQRTLQFRPDDTPEEKLQKLEHALEGRGRAYRLSENSMAQVIASAAKQSLPETEIASSPPVPHNDTTRLQEMISLFAALLSLPHPEGFPALTLSPQKQKEKTYEALVAWLCEEAKQHAVVYSWEDLHWADPSTLELLTLFLNQVPTTRLLAVLTFRPEFLPPWSAHSYLSQLTLSRLGRAHVETMVEKVTGGKSLPSEVLQQIVNKTDGVPLFVEELTKSVVESVGAQHAAPSPVLGIPATLQDALMARLDRLGTAKEIAQLGATLGREFTYEVLHAVSPLHEEALQYGLRQLVETELVFQSGVPPQARYLFKHALVQDTAYQSLLKSKRQQLHQQIAQVLAERFPETAETQPELLAHHYTEAGFAAQAIPYWQNAGQRAAQRSAHVEAISHLTKGLGLLKTLPDIPKRSLEELSLQIALAAPLGAVKGFGAPELEETYNRARELCQQVGETPQLLPTLVGLGAFYEVRGELRTAHELEEQLLHLAQQVKDPVFLVWAHYMLGDGLFWMGEFVPAQVNVEQSIALYDTQEHPTPSLPWGVNSQVASYGIAGLALWHLGYPDQAVKRCYEALAHAQKLAHPLSLATAFQFVAVLHQYRREAALTQERAEASITLSHEHGFPFYLALGTLFVGWALATQGQGEEGIAQMRQGIATWRATGAEVRVPSFFALLADVYQRAGRAREGLSVLMEAVPLMERNGEHFIEAELYRLKGELTLQKLSVISSQLSVTDPRPLTPDPHGEAEDCFLKAIEIARHQQAKSLELRAVMSLVRLRQRQATQYASRNTQHEARNILDEAYKVLFEIYNWFTEGFDTKDLQEAKVLLAELQEKT